MDTATDLTPGAVARDTSLPQPAGATLKNPRREMPGIGRWAWKRNPGGTLADWNTHVTCDHQPLSAAGGVKAR
jgi:hypothetical protein